MMVRAMTRQVNIAEAKAKLSELVDDAEAGKSTIIARAGRPVARLVPLDEAPPKRRFGLLKGRMTIAADFDAPLPDELVNSFYGGDA
jgi:prevent-host-death family protein